MYVYTVYTCMCHARSFYMGRENLFHKDGGLSRGRINLLIYEKKLNSAILLQLEKYIMSLIFSKLLFVYISTDVDSLLTQLCIDSSADLRLIRIPYQQRNRAGYDVYLGTKYV